MAHLNATLDAAGITTTEVNQHLLTVQNNDWLSPFNHTAFVDGFVSSMTVVIVAELGDRTFFIAAILAVKHARIMVFMGQMLAQTAMTIASVALGMAAHFIPRYVLHYLSIVLFFLFGCKMTYEARGLCPGVKGVENTSPSDIERDLEDQNSQRRNRRLQASAFATAFSMTLVAECGDRSQFATIVLVATKDVRAVALGTLLGHAFCTLLAVLFGRAMAAYIPVRVLTLVGALLFFGFAIVALISGYEEISEDDYHMLNLTTTTAMTTTLSHKL